MRACVLCVYGKKHMLKSRETSRHCHPGGKRSYEWSLLSFYLFAGAPYGRMGGWRILDPIINIIIVTMLNAHMRRFTFWQTPSKVSFYYQNSGWILNAAAAAVCIVRNIRENHVGLWVLLLPAPHLFIIVTSVGCGFAPDAYLRKYFFPNYSIYSSITNSTFPNTQCLPFGGRAEKMKAHMNADNCVCTKIVGSFNGDIFREQFCWRRCVEWGVGLRRGAWDGVNKAKTVREVNVFPVTAAINELIPFVSVVIVFVIECTRFRFRHQSNLRESREMVGIARDNILEYLRMEAMQANADMIWWRRTMGDRNRLEIVRMGNRTTECVAFSGRFSLSRCREIYNV